MERDLQETEPVPAAADGIDHCLGDLFVPYPYLTIYKLREDLKWQKNITDEVSQGLLIQVCDCSVEVWGEPTNVHECRSGIRYHVLDEKDMTLKLVSEWVRIFELRSDYLELAPPEIQAEYAVIQRAQKTSTVAGEERVSLVAWVQQRLESDKKIREDATLGSKELAYDFVNLTQATLSRAGPSLPDQTTLRSRKRGREHDESASRIEIPASRPQKRTAQPGQVGTPQVASFAPYPVPMPPMPSMPPSSAFGPAVQTVQPTPATNVASQPAPPRMRNGARQGLRPEKGYSSWDYEWSEGRKRAWLLISHFGQQLPPTAYVDYWNEYTSQCTSAHADIRFLGDLHITVVELITVSDHGKDLLGEALLTVL